MAHSVGYHASITRKNAAGRSHEHRIAQSPSQPPKVGLAEFDPPDPLADKWLPFPRAEATRIPNGRRKFPPKNQKRGVQRRTAPPLGCFRFWIFSTAPRPWEPPAAPAPYHAMAADGPAGVDQRRGRHLRPRGGIRAGSRKVSPSSTVATWTKCPNVFAGYPKVCSFSIGAVRRLNVRFLEELTAGRNGLNLSPTACRNERKGPSNRRGAAYACPDRRRPYLETRSGERLASHGERKLRKPPSLDRRAAVSMVTPGPGVGGFRFCFFLETRRQNAYLASAVASQSLFG